MNEPPLSDEEFLDALPGFLNGTLDAALRERVERHLQTQPGAARALAQQRALRDIVRSNAADVPADLGWEDYARRHGIEPAAEAAPVRKRPSWMTYGAVAVMLGQAAVIGALWMGRESNDRDFSPVRSGAQARPESPLLQVRFKPEAAELDVRKLVLGIEGRIVDGPNQFGDYLVSVPVERVEAARDALRTSPLVLSATVQR